MNAQQHKKKFSTHAKAIKFMRTKKECTLSGKDKAWIVTWVGD